MKAKLTRLHKGTSLRTGIINGEADMFPQIGESFVMFSQGLELGIRTVKTSPVKKIESEHEDTYIIYTETGSIYKIELELPN